MLSSVQPLKSTFTGNGVTTAFTTSFAVFRTADLDITVNGATVTTGFTVSDLGNISGATITFDVAPANGDAIVALLDPALTRDTDYQSNGDVKADTLNRDFDRLWQALQTQDPSLQDKYAYVNMGGGNYTMTDAEANAPVKVILGGVEGTTLTWPSSCDAAAPSSQKLYFVECEAGITLASETGGDTAVTTLTHQNADIVFVGGLAVVILDDNYVGVREISATSYTVTKADRGAALSFTSNSPVTLTINTDVSFPGMNFIVIQRGSGQVTFAGTATFQNAYSHTKTLGQYATVAFICDTASDKFVFGGATA